MFPETGVKRLLVVVVVVVVVGGGGGGGGFIANDNLQKTSCRQCSDETVPQP